MNALLFERPVWFTSGPLVLEEEAQEREEVIYHRPVLVREAVELLKPRAGALVLDATWGGGGGRDASFKAGGVVSVLGSGSVCLMGRCGSVSRVVEEWGASGSEW